MLEKMGEFFDARLNQYEKHQLNNIDSAKEFYPFTASCLPKTADCEILDLGIGSGLELNYYFKICPTAKITGIDIAPAMLEACRNKFSKKNIKLILGSYFNTPFGENKFDAAVSVQSLHHFTKKEKISLYEKLLKSLKSKGYFILTDYFSLSESEEKLNYKNLLHLKKQQNIIDKELYHYDIPLTVHHEIEALKLAGFSRVEILKNWKATHTLKAIK